MHPLIKPSALQSDELVLSGPRGGPPSLQQGRAPVPRLHLPLSICRTQAEAGGNKLACPPPQTAKTSKVQFRGAACDAHRQLQQLHWTPDVSSSIPESVLHLCTYRGDPKRPLQADGGPQGFSQALPSARPSTLLHAFAQTKGFNQLGGGDCPFSSNRKSQVESNINSLKTARAPDGMGSELRVLGAPRGGGSARCSHAGAPASQLAETQEGSCGTQFHLQQQQQQPKQQLPVAARLRLDLESVAKALDKPASQLAETQEGSCGTQFHLQQQQQQPKQQLPVAARLRLDLGSVAKALDSNSLGGPSSPCCGDPQGCMGYKDTPEDAAAHGDRAGLQQHNEWHAEPLSPQQLQLRRQHLQQQQRRGYLTARASISCNSHLQGVLFCGASPRAPRSHVQNLVQQLEARRLRSKGGGALRFAGGPMSFRADRPTLRCRQSIENTASARGPAEAPTATAAAPGGPEAGAGHLGLRIKEPQPDETLHRRPAATACGGEAAGEVSEESWETGGLQGPPLGSPLLQAALTRGPPEKVVGSYLLGRTIGEGTFGKVRVATHALTGECVAVKVLEKDKLKAAEDAERVLREIHILRAVRHPHIIHLLEILETASRLYLVMELASGGELFDFIVKRQRVDEGTARRLFRQILSGVEALHSLCICHRDLKPENLLLDASMNIKIVDFGLSNIYSHKPMLKTACGSPSYAAPEIVQGKLYSPLAVDIWSCGVILYALLVGRLPFEENTTEALYRSIVSGQFGCPDYLSPEAASLLRGILHTCPLKRLGPLQIKQHPCSGLAGCVAEKEKDTSPEACLPPAGPVGPPSAPFLIAAPVLSGSRHHQLRWLLYLHIWLRRDILEQMPPSHYSLEALECHIRCHPVGAQAATYYLLCLKKRREEEAAAAAAAAGAGAASAATTRQQQRSPSLPSCKGPAPAVARGPPQTVRKECRDTPVPVTAEQKPTASPQARRDMETGEARRSVPRSEGAPREAPKTTPSNAEGSTVAQKRLKGVSCSSETSLQQRLQQQRQQHQLKLTEKLLEPLACRSIRDQATPSSNSNSPTDCSPASSADASPQAQSAQLQESSIQTQTPRAAQEGPSGRCAQGPQGQTASQLLQNGTPPPPAQDNLHPTEGQIFSTPAGQSSMQQPAAGWEAGTGRLQQQGRSPALQQEQVAAPLQLQQLQQKHQEDEHERSLHPPPEGGLAVLESAQTLLQQQTSSKALQLTQLAMRNMFVRQHQQLRGESLHPAMRLGGSHNNEDYPLRGLLTARGPPPPSPQLNNTLGAPKSPGRALQSLVSPRCVLAASDLLCGGSTQQQEQQQLYPAAAPVAAAADSGSSRSTCQAQQGTFAQAEAVPLAAAALRPPALEGISLADPTPETPTQQESKSGLSGEGTAPPCPLSRAAGDTPKVALPGKGNCKQVQAGEEHTQEAACSAADATHGVPSTTSRSPTNSKRSPNTGCSSNSSDNSSSNSNSCNSCGSTDRSIRGGSSTASSGGPSVRTRKPPGISCCQSLQKQQRQAQPQRGQQPPLQHSNTWQAKRGSIRGEQQRPPAAAAAPGHSAMTADTPRALSRTEAITGAPMGGAPTVKPSGKAGVSKGPPRRVAPLRLSLSTGSAPPVSAAAAAAATRAKAATAEASAAASHYRSSNGKPNRSGGSSPHCSTPTHGKQSEALYGESSSGRQPQQQHQDTAQ
ncbi:CAM kinase, SNF1 family, putative [Eimeria praecox]|uniref:CAM kinase, SNF1 family, putative n=1 Tax=Eimeria praecox TaxID=51316 RepID=U6GPE5_9EIME|nr:CAM kinase, SNF1 family, putative [Eimeria praecox]